MKIRTNVIYPEEAKEHFILGEVKTAIYINETGRMVKDSVRIAVGLGYGCNEEALRLIDKYANKKWEPATNKNGDPIPTWIVIPVTFKND